MVRFSKFTLNIKIYDEFIEFLSKLVWRETLFLLIKLNYYSHFSLIYIYIYIYQERLLKSVNNVKVNRILVIKSEIMYENLICNISIVGMKGRDEDIGLWAALEDVK